MTNIGAIGCSTTTSKPNMDPEAYAKQYAEEHRISVEEAKAELKAKHGEPQKPGDQRLTMNGSIFSNYS